MIQQKLKDKTLFKKQCFVDGHWIDSSKGQNIDINNPFDGSITAQVPSLEVNQVRHAIDVAYKAFSIWKQSAPEQRSSLLIKWFELLKQHIDDLASIIVAEQGKPLSQAKSEIAYAASYLEFYAQQAKCIDGEVISSVFEDTKAMIIKQPIGVVGIITPWNFPVAMMVRKVATALACGCTCVIKPDERTPLSALAVLELAQRAGIPNGVLNAVTGIPQEIGDEFTKSEKISKISFTGSTKVGKLLLEKSASTVKRVTMELGGNAPFIVFDDADIDLAVEGLIAAKFRNSGQTCVCANRVFLHQDIKEKFIEKLILKVKALRVGNGFDDPDIAPLINMAAVEKIQSLISDALGKGADLLYGGKRHSLGGTFFQPTVIDGVDRSMSIFKQEIFGPVISIVSFTTTDEVIDLANDTRYGLASYFYAKDMKKIWKVSQALEYGMVGVNRGGISSAKIPFGGVKESGMGREGSHYGMNDYLSIKYVCMSY